MLSTCYAQVNDTWCKIVENSCHSHTQREREVGEMGRQGQRKIKNAEQRDSKDKNGIEGNKNKIDSAREEKDLASSQT